MTNLLGTLLQIVVPLFAVSSMISVGLAYSTRQILDPLRNRGGVLRAIATNFVVVPLLALVIAQVLSLERPVAIGLTLLGTAAGAPFVVKLTQVARGDVAFSATLLVLLLGVTIIYMPIVVPLAVPGATVKAIDIGTTLSLTMLLPLAIGHMIEARAPKLADRFQPVMAKLSSISLMGLIAATFILHLPGIIEIGPAAILAAALLTGCAFACGYLLINRRSPRRSVLGLGSAQRNIAAATVVAQTFADPAVLVMVVVASIVDLAVLFPIAGILRRRAVSEQLGAPSDQESPENQRRTA